MQLPHHYQDISPFREKEDSRCWWDQDYIFLIKREVEWSLAWGAIIEWEHSDLEENVEDNTWFEEEYEKAMLTMSCQVVVC